MEASAKKGKNGLSVAADVTSALDVSKARSAKQQKMARQEALAIAKVIEQSKEDLGVGKLIQQHSKSKGGTKDWDSMWESKHSLVSRLAAQVGLNGKAQAAHKQGTAAAAKQIKGQQAAAHKAVHAGADEHNKDVPLAIRKVRLLVYIPSPLLHLPLALLLCATLPSPLLGHQPRAHPPARLPTVALPSRRPA